MPSLNTRDCPRCGAFPGVPHHERCAYPTISVELSGFWRIQRPAATTPRLHQADSVLEMCTRSAAIAWVASGRLL